MTPHVRGFHMHFFLYLQHEGAEGGHSPPEVFVEGRGHRGVVYTLLEEGGVIYGRVKTRYVQVGIQHTH